MAREFGLLGSENVEKIKELELPPKNIKKL
jgi:hypothetical protein